MPINDLQLNRICLSLKSEDKSRRKEALRELHSTLLEDSYEWNLEASLKVWEIVENDLTTHLTDEMEFCRNTCAEIWKFFIKILPISEKRVVRLIPTLSRRLGSQELLETSEEVRLNYLKLLTHLVDKYQKVLSIYCDDFVGITSRTVTDSYPAIKRESCNLIVSFSKSMSAQFFAKSESLVRPVLSNFTHNHWRVRVASVTAIGQILLSGNSKSIEEVATPMAERLFDQSAAVRRAVIDVAGIWLLELRDRYSWWHKLLPLLLTGLHDEIESIRERANDIWNETGKLYMSENENDEKFKEKKDFEGPAIEHYPSNVTRANMGCRVLVQQNFCKLIGGITRELGDWLADIRVRSAQLLCVLVLNAEAGVTQHVEKLLPAMYRACNDKDSRVVENVELAAYYMAHFLRPSIWCPLVLPTLEETITSGHLRVLHYLLRGSDFKYVEEQLPEIVNFLQQSHVCTSSKPRYREQLAHCLNELVQDCIGIWSQVSQGLFTIILTLAATSQEDSVLLIVEKLLDDVVHNELTTNRDEFMILHIRPIFIELEKSCDTWTFHSEELKIFRFSLNYASVACWKNSDLILSIMKRTMNDQTDPEMRLQLFISLADLLENKHHVEKFDSNAASILYEIVIPELVWKPGKVAETIRCAALCCLCEILDYRRKNSRIIEKSWTEKTFEKIQVPRFVCINDEMGESGEWIKKGRGIWATNEETIGEDHSSLITKLIPILASLVDDHAKKTRLYALRAIGLLFSGGKTLEVVKDVEIHEIYPPVLKRLDDGSDDVRNVACEALVCIWGARPKNYDVIFSRGQIDYLYTSAIVHLDDPDDDFQSRMLGALVKLAEVHPCLLAEKIEKCRGNFRNQAGLETLLKTCDDLLKTNN